MEGPISGLHNPRVRVGEVALSVRGDGRVRRRVVNLLRGSIVIVALVPGLLLRVFPRLGSRVCFHRDGRFSQFHQT